MDIQFGPLAPLITDQLARQGYTIDRKLVCTVANCVFYLDYLVMHGVISHSARDLGRKRLLKLIERHATRV